METVCFSEIPISSYESTRRHDPEKQHRHPRRRGNLKSHMIHMLFHIMQHGVTTPMRSTIPIS
jgi:hypothetical protein